MKEIKNDMLKIHKENRSIFILFWRIFTLQVAAVIIKYLTSIAFIEDTERTTFTYIFFVSVFLNFVACLSIFINWLYHYYILTEDGISISRGFLFFRSRSFDFLSIKSIRLRQSLMGKIFNYGTVELDIPGIKKMPVLDSISNPHEYAKMLEEQRLKYLERESRHEQVTSAIGTNL